MKTKGKKDNFRVVVSPRSLTDFGFLSTSRSMFYGYDAEGQKRFERDSFERCEQIASDIKRHSDNVAHVQVEFDQEELCEHCGYAWTEKSDSYNGGCCEKDEESNPAPATVELS